MRYAIVNNCGGTWRLEECHFIEIEDSAFEELMETGAEKWWHFKDDITGLLDLEVLKEAVKDSRRKRVETQMRLNEGRVI